MAKEQGKLSKEYIHDHRHSTHTPDSFARALVDAILRTAEEKVGTDYADSVELDFKATVRAVAKKDCIEICVGVGPAQVCYHKEV